MYIINSNVLAYDKDSITYPKHLPQSRTCQMICLCYIKLIHLNTLETSFMPHISLETAYLPL